MYEMGWNVAFRHVALHIFYRNKIIHYDSKLFYFYLFLKSLQRVCTKQKQDGPL